MLNSEATNTFSFFSKMKDKYKNIAIEEIYANQLAEIDCSMFEYSDLPETINGDYIEQFLISGSCIFAEIPTEGLVVTQGEPSGKPDAYGIGKQAIAATQNGKTARKTVGVDCVIGYNNRLHTSDIDIMMYASQLAEVTKSLNIGINNTRIVPIAIANTTEEKKQLEKIFTTINEGGFHTIIADLKKMWNEAAASTPLGTKIDLTDPTLIEKLQYLTHLTDDIFRQFLNRYGQSVNGTGKMAQQSVFEIQGDLSVSFIYPLDKLEQRKKMIEEVNKMFNTNIKVDFSPAWKKEYEKFMQSQEVVEELPDPEEKEGAENGDNEE